MEKLPMMEEGVAIKLVESDEQLQEAVEQLRKYKELALDLEFDQNRFTYGFTLCLVQIADGNGTCYIIDPFPIHDLTPIYDLFGDPSITKIIHHSNNDILLLDKLGCRLRGIMDTDVAAKILNYERSSLATVLKTEFETEIDKSQQSSNWNKRPLTEGQLRYAAIDVIYLHRIMHKLVHTIKQQGRLHWLEEENHLLEQLRYTESEHPHMRLRNAFRLNYYQQFILSELYAFREEMGKQFNKPAPYIIGNESLVELANNPNIDLHEWLNHTKGIHGGLKKPRNERLMKEALDNAKLEAKKRNISHDYPDSRYQRPLRTPETDSRKEALTLVQKSIMEQYGEFAARLIINQNLITYYSQNGVLLCNKKYATDIVLATAAAIGVELPAPVLKTA